jgi:hypothetical protein
MTHPGEVYALEESLVVDQRRQRVLAFIEGHAPHLARQGAVVSSFRRRGGRKIGAYYRLAFRDGRVQRSLYLGDDMVLVNEVRAALETLQRPHRERHALLRQKKAIRRALAQCRAQLKRELARRGWWLQGYEVRGWHTPRPRAPITSRSVEAGDGTVVGSVIERGRV